MTLITLAPLTPAFIKATHTNNAELGQNYEGYKVFIFLKGSW